jgi:hypothetical protein
MMSNARHRAGMAPTFRRVEVPFMVVIEIADGVMTCRHLNRNRAWTLVPIGKLKPAERRSPVPCRRAGCLMRRCRRTP